MENAVLYAVENNIATITLNRPSSLNSMNDALIDGIHEALDKVQADAEVKCVVLTGNGKAFCAGGDLPFLETIDNVADKKAFIAKVGDVAKRITTIEKPFICMINGVTAGAGVNLMLSCDSSILAWEIPWTEEPEGYSPQGHRESDTTAGLNSSIISQPLEGSISEILTFCPFTAQGLRKSSGLGAQQLGSPTPSSNQPGECGQHFTLPLTSPSASVFSSAKWADGESRVS